MTSFRIEIPEQNLAAYDTEVMERAGRLIGKINRLTGWNNWTHRNYQVFDRMVAIWAGERASPHIVTILAAMAQGHTLEPILDHISLDIIDQEIRMYNETGVY